MPTPPQTRKPIPTDPVKWRRELDGVAGFVRKLETNEYGEGADWVERMLAYNRLRLQDLKDNPPAAPKRARRARRSK